MSVVIPSLRAAIAVPPWVKNELWRRAHAVPSLDLRFADNKSLVDSVTGASLVTFTRASSGTFVGSDGVIATASNDVPRFDHNPTTGESLGLLVEEQRSNLLLNSATLSTQSVTVAAAANTLSFYGTGTVTLTGVSTAGPLVGTGANNRVSLTFTPTVGVLVLTISGSVTNAQLEAGAFPTSYIPTTSAAVTRSADVCSITGSAFSSWYRQDEGTVFADITRQKITGFPGRVRFWDGTTANTIDLYYDAAGNSSVFDIKANNTASVSISGGGGALNTPVRTAAGWQADNAAVIYNGSIQGTDSSVVLPVVDRVLIANNLVGTIRRICFWPQRLANSTLQALSQ